ncbi:Hypothetical protein DEACI_4232 [Acididesulfobacillus acetoxydans]|uniref:Uncharacterized protein n=1 Tax=Acididesulfobacillus acetoxydans TaxID=1561005 RepID=A0A8S0WAF6_9FIRM|nr:Hypothetical protein DEACI_4232 [Acididesulfobacillus acetoxydans]CEJ06494.1 Hypothetical protein DEACI_0942 [Acididesulfobacillus acetoxydans]
MLRRLIGKITRKPGMHTLAFDAVRQHLYVFLPLSDRSAVYRKTDREDESPA